MALNLQGLTQFVRSGLWRKQVSAQERATSFSNLAAQVIAAIRDDLDERDLDAWQRSQ